MNWKFNNARIPDAKSPVLILHDISFAQLGEYECSLEESMQPPHGCSLVKNKSPFKWCESCLHRNHAHAKQCIQCHHPLQTKTRPPKRRCESLTMKNYEDAIVEKVRKGRGGLLHFPSAFSFVNWFFSSPSSSSF